MPDDTKSDRVPRKYETLPDEYQAKRQVNGSEVAWTFKKGLLRKKGKTGPDRFALRPVRPASEDEKSTLIGFGGIDLTSELFLRATSQMAAKWSLNAFDKNTGLFVPSLFDTSVSKFSARGQTITALKEELADLTDEMVEVSKDTKMTSDLKMKRFTEIADRVAEIQEAIDAKQRDKEDEDEDVADAVNA